jgi:transposase
LTFGSSGSTRSHNPSETTHGATAIGTPQSLRTDADKFADYTNATFISIRVLSAQERDVLERWAWRPKSAQALALRCRIVLAAADGERSNEIAARLGCSTQTVGRWRGRFARRGLDGLHDEPRPGKPRSISDADVERVIVKTLEEQPQGATHWSTRSMAAATGMSQTAVSRIWRAFALKPHQSETFKLSPDPQFIDKVRDIVGLYLNPPEAAVVLCVDEKAQIQALDRSAPMLPLMPGVPQRHTHDYVRNGTTNLYAALDLASGQVIAEMTPRHRAEEFRRFLNMIDASVPAHLEVHVVLEDSSTHKTPSIQRWLVRHPRFTLHFTPTYSSWLNLVERWFAELTTKWIKRSTHRSVRDLVASIRTWITNWNEDPKPYVWHKTADEILTSLANYCQRINDSGH